MSIEQNELEHVYWIGGGSGAGKSTIARRLAARHGLCLYESDRAMAEHARRSAPKDAPLLHAFMEMDMDQRWVRRPPGMMLDTFPWFHGEAFDGIVTDLRQLPKEPAMVVEGFRLLPRLVEPLLACRTHAVWLLSSPAFREAVFSRRGGPAWAFLAKTSEPVQALRNLLERDRLFTDIVRRDASRLGLPLIELDTSMTEEELEYRVSELFFGAA